MNKGSNEYTGMNIVIMGLGLNGGNLEAAVYLGKRGAELCVTDLRDETVLAPSIETLARRVPGARVRYVLGRHEIDDFKRADLVIKNPGVRPDSSYLAAARRIETDISLFLMESPARLSAVTGSKGKSSIASALHWVLAAWNAGDAAGAVEKKGRAFLGGNITLSPLSFLNELTPLDDVVLELSSWQLGDIRGRMNRGGGPLLKPRAAVVSSIMPDHLDRYGSMELYVADKRVIYQGQDEGDLLVTEDDAWGASFRRESRARNLVYGSGPPADNVNGGFGFGFIDEKGRGLARAAKQSGAGPAAPAYIELVPPGLLTPGAHQKKNLLAAGLALLDLGLPADFIRENLGTFPGIEHRLEFFHESGGIRFYNDSAATIPEAAAAAISAFETPPILVAGGNDKNLDFTPLVKAAPGAKAVVLLAGTGSTKLAPLLAATGIACAGPFDSLDAAITAALDRAQPGSVVVLSPGCTSFGMFLNEFDRGKKWKEAVRRLCS